MIIATPTNFGIPYIRGPYFSDTGWIERTFRRLRGSGFTLLDWSSCDFARIFTEPGETPLVRDGWRDFAVALREAAERSGVRFHQAHGLIFNPFDGSRQSEFLLGIEPRVFCVCSVLGIRYLVTHPMVPPVVKSRDDLKTCIAYNAKRICGLADLASEYGINVAVENMFSTSEIWRMCDRPDDMLALIEEVNRDNVCVCLDVGHAHIMGENLTDTCKRYGSLLKCVHIHDNDGKYDQHRLPMHGNVNWDAFMAGLSAAGYNGDFTLEAHPVLNGSEALRAHREREAYLVSREILISNGNEVEA